MKITSCALSLPPYISTAWKNIASLHVETHSSILVLIVTLNNGTQIEVPHLETSLIQTIFNAHAQHLELEQNPSQPSSIGSIARSLPLNRDNLTNLTPLLDGNMNILQHNAEQTDTPDLPPELLNHITNFSKTLGIQDLTTLPRAEPDCNCPHCQISRALQSGSISEDVPCEEEIVSDEELQFRTWNIEQTADKLFIVQNPIDEQEHYQVYLGEPLGCTCGHKNCEHIRAVLSESI